MNIFEGIDGMINRIKVIGIKYNERKNYIVMCEDVYFQPALETLPGDLYDVAVNITDAYVDHIMNGAWDPAVADLEKLRELFENFTQNA